ncbi:MAG TPA: SdpI family protein [Phycisphaerales bacterium]
MSLLIWIVFAASALFLALLGVPLARGRVAPNGLYGFRVQATLDDPAIWYPVNRLSGLWLLATGGVVIVSTTTLYGLGIGPGTAAGINLAALGLCVAASVVHGLIVSSRLAKASSRAGRTD